jgi:hypothetical protein
VEILNKAVEGNHEDRDIISVLSIMLIKLKNKVVESILGKYKIDEQVFSSPSLKEESEELLK